MVREKKIFALGVIMVAVLLCIFAGCEQSEEPARTPRQEHPAYDGTIVAVGDSLTAGLRVDESEAWPAQLERKLLENGYHWRVVNAGITGETSSGVRSRINWVLKLKPDIVILETGANDGLRGIDPRILGKNLDETVRVLKKSNVTVVLAGMRMVTNLGREYTRSFAAIYPAAARKHGLILIPFLLAHVAGDPSLNQSDGIHPTPEGYRVVTDTIYPYVIRAVEKRKAGAG